MLLILLLHFVYFVGVAIATAKAPLPRRRFYAQNIHDLTDLATKDMIFAGQLQLVRNEISLKSELRTLVDYYLADFNDGNGVSEASSLRVEDIVGNPVSVYRLIRRCFLMINDIFGKSRGKLGNHMKADVLPIREDLSDFTDAILRIQTVYNLSASELAQGNIRGLKTKAKLGSVHCMEIASHARHKEQFVLAVEWFREAIKRTGVDRMVPVQLIRRELDKAMKLHDAKWIAEARKNSTLSNLNLYLHPISRNAVHADNAPKIRDFLQQMHEAKLFPSSLFNQWGLCSGQNYQTPEEESYLFCWLEFEVHKIYTIGPLKMEFLSLYPSIVQIYEALSNKDMAELKSSGKSLDPSAVADITQPTLGDSSKIDTRRSSSQTWLENNESMNFIRKAELMTGLNVEALTASESTQVASYVVGAHYDYHVDALQREHVYGEAGDRIATFMAYLNDVKRGGFTSFPIALAAAKPIKGSAVFWFNVLSDGTADQATGHAACPVVSGQKEVANKWVRMYDQFNTRRCLLDPKERFQIPVNGKNLQIPLVLRERLHLYESTVGSD